MINANEARQMTNESDVVEETMAKIDNLVYEKANKGSSRAMYSVKRDIEASAITVIASKLEELGYNIKTQESNNSVVLIIDW